MTSEMVIWTARQILRTHQYATMPCPCDCEGVKLDCPECYGSGTVNVVCDVQTASAIVTVFDALPPDMQIRYLNKIGGDVRNAGGMAWNVIHRAAKKARPEDRR